MVFLAGILVGAVVAVATIRLLESEEVVVRAAAMAPLVAAVVVVGVVLWRHGRTGASADVSIGQVRETDPRYVAEWANNVPDLERAEEDSEARGGAARVSQAESSVGRVSESQEATTPRAGEPDPGSGDAPKSDVPPDDADDGPLEILQPDLPGTLIKAWERYRREGDGFFTAKGLRQQLDALGIAASVQDGSAVDALGDLLLVTVGPGGGAEGHGDRFFVVPSFVKSPRAAQDWFEDASSGALSTTTTTIHRIAEGRWTSTSFTVIARGRIG